MTVPPVLSTVVELSSANWAAAPRSGAVWAAALTASPSSATIPSVVMEAGT
jgi:hypothetical protein